MRPLLQTLLFTLMLSVWVDPQGSDFSLPTPSVRQALSLANYLMRRPLGPRSVRRDCRLIPARDLETIFDSIRAAKADTRLRPNVHDAFSFLHSHPQVNTGAHGGAGFLPWHRVFIFLYEKMLRLYEPTVSLCYWDSTLEPDQPSESSTFTSALFGSGDGQVVGGPGDQWTTPVGRLTRNHGVRGRTLTMADIEMVLSKSTMGQISFPNGDVSANAEELHNHVHVHVGGHMGQIETAAYDPIFWFHHTFMDCIYEWFRIEQRRRGRVNVERDWPRDWGERPHGPFRPMRLGSLRNIDGQNEFFNRRIFRCERVPRCRTNNDCGSHMTCEARSSRCVSRTGRTQSNSFFQQLMGMFGPSGNLGNLGSVFGGNSRGFNPNTVGPGGMPGMPGAFGPGGFGGGGGVAPQFGPGGPGGPRGAGGPGFGGFGAPGGRGGQGGPSGPGFGGFGGPGGPGGPGVPGRPGFGGFGGPGGPGGQGGPGGPGFGGFGGPGGPGGQGGPGGSRFAGFGGLGGPGMFGAFGKK